MRVILFLLKCLVGVFAAIGFLLVVAAIVLVVAWERIEPLTVRHERVPDTAIVTVDLTRGLVEARSDNPLARASQGDVLVLRETLDAIEAAGRDARVRGLLMRLGRGAVGLAEAQELREAIKGFREQGKFALAFAETFAEAGSNTVHYYLASAADDVWVQPSGDVDVSGFLLQSPFLSEALNELGVQPRIAQRGEYKGAANVLTDRDLPEPQRRNLQNLVDSWLEQIVAGISTERDLPAQRVRALIDSAPHSAEQAQSDGLIDRLGYLGEVRAEALVQAELDPTALDEAFVDIADYGASRDEPTRGAVIALIYGLGAVVLDESENDPVFGRLVMGADTVSQAIDDAVADPAVRAIVFRINSPGGSYVASDAIWDAVRRARAKGKPVIASMGNVAASGGYFVAAPANAIVAQPGTITGSIGVVGGKVVLSGLWDKLGVNWDGVSAGRNADFWSNNRDFSEAQWDQLQSAIQDTYDDFVQKVADGRNLPADQVLGAAEGRVWTGADAKEQGLVDALGGFATAHRLAKEAAGIAADEPMRVKVFPEQRDPLQALIEDALGRGGGPGVAAAARMLTRLARLLAPLAEVAEGLGAAGPGYRLQAPELRLSR